MTDYISRQEAIEALDGEITVTGSANAEAVRGYVRLVNDRLKRLPSVQPERKKGKWTIGADMPPMRYRNGKPKKFWSSLRYCSVCGHEAFDDSDWGDQLFAWCPYCGADMRGET